MHTASPLLDNATATPSSNDDPAQPTPLRTCFLAHEEGQLAYDDTGGEGPLIVALPGMGDLRSEYRALRPMLTAAGYRVVTLDIRGHGETSASWRDYSAEAIGRDTVALIRHLGAGPAVVLGNSFAAGSALWAAQQAPGCVRAAVLLGPVVRDAKPSWLARAALAVGFAGPWRVGFWITFWNSLFPGRKPADHEQARSALARNLREPARMAALQAMIGLSKRRTEAMLETSRVPALVVMGSLDPDFKQPEVEAKWLAKRLAAGLLMVPGAGHYPHLEFPQAVAPGLLAFMDGLPPPQAQAREDRR